MKIVSIIRLSSLKPNWLSRRTCLLFCLILWKMMWLKIFAGIDKKDIALWLAGSSLLFFFLWTGVTIIADHSNGVFFLSRFCYNTIPSPPVFRTSDVIESNPTTLQFFKDFIYLICTTVVNRGNGNVFWDFVNSSCVEMGFKVFFPILHDLVWSGLPVSIFVNDSIYSSLWFTFKLSYHLK